MWQIGDIRVERHTNTTPEWRHKDKSDSHILTQRHLCTQKQKTLYIYTSFKLTSSLLSPAFSQSRLSRPPSFHRLSLQPPEKGRFISGSCRTTIEVSPTPGNRSVERGLNIHRVLLLLATLSLILLYILSAWFNIHSLSRNNLILQMTLLFLDGSYLW